MTMLLTGVDGVQILRIHDKDGKLVKSLEAAPAIPMVRRPLQRH
jgi:hypothetical protein